MNSPFDDMDYEEVIAQLRHDLQLDARTDLLPNSLFGALGLAYGQTGAIAAGGIVTVSHGLQRSDGTGIIPQVVIAGNYWTDNTSSATWTAYGYNASTFNAINKGTTSGILAWVAFG